MKNILRLFRFKQYIKNLFVLAPLIFSFEFYHFGQTEKAVAAFILFSLLSSAVYIINDIKDIEEDRHHPVKKFRPIPNGGVSIQTAAIISFVIITLVLILSFIFNQTFFFILLAYLILNIFYSFGLKNIAILDIFIISIGFVLRVFAGAAAVDVKVTMWIILVTFLLSLFLALSKRRDDIILSGEGLDTRKNIKGYNLIFVNSGMLIMASVVIVSYIFYTISEEVIHKFDAEHLYLTVFFVILGILRYMQINFVENRSGDPSSIVLKDKFLQLSIFFWLISFLLIVFYNF